MYGSRADTPPRAAEPYHRTRGCQEASCTQIQETERKFQNRQRRTQWRNQEDGLKRLSSRLRPPGPPPKVALATLADIADPPNRFRNSRWDYSRRYPLLARIHRQVSRSTGRTLGHSVLIVTDEPESAGPLVPRLQHRRHYHRRPLAVVRADQFASWPF